MACRIPPGRHPTQNFLLHPDQRAYPRTPVACAALGTKKSNYTSVEGAEGVNKYTWSSGDGVCLLYENTEATVQVNETLTIECTNMHLHGYPPGSFSVLAAALRARVILAHARAQHTHTHTHTRTNTHTCTMCRPTRRQHCAGAALDLLPRGGQERRRRV